MYSARPKASPTSNVASGEGRRNTTTHGTNSITAKEQQQHDNVFHTTAARQRNIRHAHKPAAHSTTDNTEEHFRHSDTQRHSQDNNDPERRRTNDEQRRTNDERTTTNERTNERRRTNDERTTNERRTNDERTTNDDEQAFISTHGSTTIDRVSSPSRG